MATTTRAIPTRREYVKYGGAIAGGVREGTHPANGARDASADNDRRYDENYGAGGR